MAEKTITANWKKENFRRPGLYAERPRFDVDQ